MPDALATNLRRNGLALDIISDVLGHTSIDASRRYTQVDLIGLRSVVLSDGGAPMTPRLVRLLAHQHALGVA